LKRYGNRKISFLASLTFLSDDVINIIGDWDGSITGTPAITISSKENLLIHHPDYLITATSLSEGSVCRRKAIINNLVRTDSVTRPSSVWGNILHEVVESCMSESRWDTKFIDEEIDSVARRRLPDLLKIEMTVEEVTEKVKDRAIGLQVFSKRYMGKTPKVRSISNRWFLAGGDGHFSQTQSWMYLVPRMVNRHCLRSRKSSISRRTSGPPPTVSRVNWMLLSRRRRKSTSSVQ
jgi:hypothetical protein